MSQLTKNRNELVGIIKGAYEVLYNKNLPPQARAVAKGSIGSSIEDFRKGRADNAKIHIQNLHAYGIK